MKTKRLNAQVPEARFLKLKRKLGRRGHTIRKWVNDRIEQELKS